MRQRGNGRHERSVELRWCPHLDGRADVHMQLCVCVRVLKLFKLFSRKSPQATNLFVYEHLLLEEYLYIAIAHVALFL